MTLLVADRLTKVYEIDRVTFNAVSDVSLRLERGDFASVIGHSGSGKTTLLSIVGGIAAPSSGRVLFKDTDIYSLGSDGLSGYRCADIGFIFQFASLLPMLTARENLLLPVSFSERGDRASAEKRAAELLAKVGLGDKVNAYPAQLSGGQQRRVAIARAFMNEPGVDPRR
jgi:putative ABC transport system ATP-binding protein/lipoprotein-releasing system ATP-binding protein